MAEDKDNKNNIPVPDFITPPDLTTMTHDERSQFLEALRARRLEPVRQYEEAMAARARAQNEKIAAKIEKKAKQFETQLTRVNKGLDKLEEIGNQIAALQLQMLQE